jgi:SAM-dependent methyltransferase
VDNRWARETYPDQYRDDVNRSIGFAGVDMDMFARGKVENMLGVIETLSTVATKDASCLDIGCGIGAMHPLLIDRVGSLFGTDVSVEAIETAKSSNPQVSYSSYDGSVLPYANASFDLCSTVCVMHHVPPAQWPEFVREAFRVTRPGGLFAVYEHNPANPLTRVAVWRCPFDHDAVLLKPAKVIDLMQAAGFEIVLKQYLFFTPVDAPWARRIDARLGRVPFGAQYVVCGRKPS